MKVKIWTESGPVYELNKETMTWTRLVHSPDSCYVRTRAGDLNFWPDIAMGKPLIMIGTPLEHGNTRYIRTTPVIKIEFDGENQS